MIRLRHLFPYLKHIADALADGEIARFLQCVLALTAAIWHNDHTGRPVQRALTP